MKFKNDERKTISIHKPLRIITAWSFSIIVFVSFVEGNKCEYQRSAEYSFWSVTSTEYHEYNFSYTDIYSDVKLLLKKKMWWKVCGLYIIMCECGGENVQIVSDEDLCIDTC